jgi:type VI secretion system protein ImpL
MSLKGKELKTALLVAALVALYSIAALAAWFAGLAFGIGVAGRIVIITMIALTWPLLVLFKHYRRNGNKKRDATSSKTRARSRGPAQLPPPSRTYDELTRGAEEAVQWLRGSELGGSRKADAVFALPWFVIAGPLASGKTSLLLSSGLDFHSLPSQRATEQNLVRPTRNVEWRVSNSAIFIDTAGRYQTEGRDRDEWAGLLETLKAHRKTRPLDGFVITVNAVAVLGMSDAQIEQQAKVLRARLDEAVQRTHVRFPVYLVFTHVDAIEGFVDFFRAFTPDERAQVWGATIPLAQQQNAHTLFDDEFDNLYGRLLRRRTEQLGTLASSSEQLRLFKFPGRFRRARNRLGLFTSALFRPNPFSESPLLRGFYFTSGGDGNVAGRLFNGGDHFTRNFFRGVLLRDKDIVAASHALKRKPHFKRLAASAVAAALVLVFMGGMLVSFYKNRRLIADARARGEQLTRVRQATVRNPEQKTADAGELEAVERVREVLYELDEHERDAPPISHRFGLYAGHSLNGEDSILRHLYFEAIDERFLKPTVARVEADLRAFASAPAGATTASQEEDVLGRHYDLLKAYLMLVTPERVEPTFLANALREQWKSQAPSGKEEDALKQLDFWASQANRVDAPHPEVDLRLVAQVQSKLAAYPVINRVYKRVTAEINADVKFPVGLSTIPGAREGNVLVGSYSVPASFTIDGYRKMTEKLESSAADEFRRDDWVMNGSATSEVNFEVKKDELAAMYYRDYVAHWQKFLQEVKVRDYKSKEDAVRSLRILASSTSPLESVAREVARQTNLSAAGGGGLFGWLAGLFHSDAHAAGEATQVEKEFRPLIQFVISNDDNPPVAEFRTKLKSAGDQLAANSKSQGEIAQALQSGNDTIGLRSTRQAVADMIESKGFGASPASDAAAKLFKQPLDNLNVLLVGTDFEQIEKAWQQLYTKSWQPLEARFPFADASEDASIASLATFLNPEKGELTKFFNERLKPYFEDDWSPKKEGADKFSPEFNNFLKGARRLRDQLFPTGGAEPKVEYQIGFAAPVRDAVIKVEIDGNVLEPDKASPPFRWPGNKAGVKISFMPTSGPNTGQSRDLTQGKPYTGEWGVLRMFAEGGGGDGKAAQSQLNVNGLRLSIEPRSGSVFQRELFTALRAPKSLLRN